jgi:hypothetical protein
MAKTSPKLRNEKLLEKCQQFLLETEVINIQPDREIQ